MRRSSMPLCLLGIDCTCLFTATNFTRVCLFYSFCFLVLLCNYFFVHIPLPFENANSSLFFQIFSNLFMSDLCLGYNTRLSKQKTITFLYLTLFRLIHSAIQGIFGENLMYLIILRINVSVFI